MKRATVLVDLPSNNTFIQTHKGDCMKHALALSIIAIFLLTGAGDQEPKRITRTISSDDAVIIREIGAVIVPKNDRLTVEVILGNHEKTETDIQKDDVVLMANGKKVKSIKELREQYERAHAGDEFKLGIQRGENLMLVKFGKKSDEELNTAGGPGQMVIRMEQKDGEVMLPALGLVLMTKNNTVVVSKTLPTMEGNFKTFTPKEGDIIRSLNGVPVTSAEEFDESYTKMNQGDDITIAFTRNGKESKETFPKPKPMGRRMTITR